LGIWEGDRLFWDVRRCDSEALLQAVRFWEMWRKCDSEALLQAVRFLGMWGAIAFGMWGGAIAVLGCGELRSLLGDVGCDSEALLQAVRFLESLFRPFWCGLFPFSSIQIRMKIIFRFSIQHFL
jgi:hypothetical protein